MTFEEIYDSRPDKSEIGSSGYSNLKHLYDICQRIDPEMIVESGVWKGNSSYLFNMACFEANMYLYDIDFSNLMWKSHRAFTYFEHDIEVHKNWAIPKDHLIFFDDHIDQAKRLMWAKRMGFKNLVFDDNVGVAEAKTLKNPPVPTLQMIAANKLNFVKEYEILPNLVPEERDTKLTWVKIK